MRSRHRDPADRETGFTLVEVIVSLLLIALIAVALVGVLVNAAHSEQAVKQVTVAKNLAQQRIDQMRQLPFHVDAQNGPFRDLLDDYYPNTSTSNTTLPGGGVGHWVASGTVPGSAATGPYYQATFTSPFGRTGFTQNVYTQFLTSAEPVPAVVPAATITGLGYDANTVGKDQPPSLMVAVTVVTSWTNPGTGQAHSYRSFTQITNTGADPSLIVSQAQATALQVKSTAYDGTPLRGELATAEADGDLADSSNASAAAQGAYITDNGTGIQATQYTAVSPPNPAGTTATEPQDGTMTVGSTGCGWGSFGHTQDSDVSATTANGLPVVPSDNSSTSPTTVQASLLASGGTACAGFQFSNQIDGSTPTDPSLQLPAGPMVQVSDTSGSAPIVTGRAGVWASSNTGSAGAVTSTASVSFVQQVAVFPGLPFVPTNRSTCGNGSQPCGSGLVNVFLNSATLSCSSGSAPTGSYSGYLTYWTANGFKTVTLSWNGSGGSDPLASVDLSQPVTTYNGNPVPLSAYIQSWSSARSISTATGSLSTLSGVVAINTQPTRGSSDPQSSIGVLIGDLSCVATDSR